MDRRENLKIILTSGFATSLLLSIGCKPTPKIDIQTSQAPKNGYGRTPDEMEKDEKIMEETFFTEKELAMLGILVDIIIPADEVSGSANDADVVDFIEFMVKDYPPFQVPLRGGLMWLENQCLSRYGVGFLDTNDGQKLEIIDMIAYPDKAEANMKFGVRFFNTLRNLTCTGFFTTEMGIKDMGYLGNTPNQWDGVPEEVMAKFGLNLDEKYKDIYLKLDTQHTIVSWDENGNIIG